MTRSDRTQLLLARPCPTCRAQAGKWCRTRNGKLQDRWYRLHQARVDLAPVGLTRDQCVAWVAACHRTSVWVRISDGLRRAATGVAA